MKNSDKTLIYIIYAGLNTLNLVGFAFFILLLSYKTNDFVLAVLIIFVFLIANIAIYWFLKYISTKFKWYLWVDFILCNLIGFIYSGFLLILGIAIAIPNLEAPGVY